MDNATIKSLSFSRALNEALREEMIQDKNVFIFGEDIGILGGYYGVTSGLLKSFGSERVIDMPLNEEIFVGIAIGAAQLGLKPIIEFGHANFLLLAFCDIYRSGIYRSECAGKLSLPIVIRAPFGDKKYRGPELAGDLIRMFYNVPGIKIVVPSTPYRAKGLLKAAVRDPNPVLFFEHEKLYFENGFAPLEEYTCPIEKASLISEGSDLSIISYGYTLKLIIEIISNDCKELKVDILDLVTLKPLDKNSIVKSAKKTGKVLIVEEGNEDGGMGSIISTLIHEFDSNINVSTIGAKNLPLPAGNLAPDIIPSKNSIMLAIKKFFNQS